MRFANGVSSKVGAMVIALGIAGCGGGGSSSSGAVASGTVGPAGGTLTSSDGRVVLAIPAGALGNAVEIRITELSTDKQPAAVRSLDPDRVYKLEPTGTQFAVPARLSVTLPASPTGDLALLSLHTNGVFEAPPSTTVAMSSSSRVLSADIPHFTEAVVKNIDSVHATLVASKPSTAVGTSVDATFTLVKDPSPDLYTFVPEPGFEALRSHLSMQSGSEHGLTEFGMGVVKTLTETRSATCTSEGSDDKVTYTAVLLDYFAGAFGAGAYYKTFIYVEEAVACTAALPPTASVVSVGLFNVPGLTAPDGINYFAGPFAGLSGAGPYAAIAGSNGFKVLDLVTREAVLDRTFGSSDGASLGSGLLGVVPFAPSASAGAPAGLYGFGTAAGTVQNWSAANGWGVASQTLGAYLDVVTAGGGLVSNTVAALGPVRGLEFTEFDPVAQAYVVRPGRSVPTSAFGGAGQLVSLQMPDANGGVLVLSRASGPSISTSGKVFYKSLDDALPATTLLSWGEVDARRLRCIPVGTKQACVATLFSGQGRAFLFDPATPNATPAVIVLTAAAGTLGVALTALPNGHVGVVMANFTANSLTVAELSADLVTIHSLGTIPAPAGCTGTAHPALFTDSEGLKAVVTCNGTGNYWVVKVPT